MAQEEKAHQVELHYLTEDDEGEASISGHTKCWRRSVDVKESRRCGRLRSSRDLEIVMPRSRFPEIPTEETEKSKNGKGFKGPGRENIKNCGLQVMSLRTPEGYVRKST